VFTCTDKHLITIDAPTGVYRDNTYGGNHQVRAPRSGPLPPGVTNACGGQTEAFTYDTSITKVIILCSDWSGAALMSYRRIDFDSMRTLNIPQRVATEQGIDIFWQGLVYKVAHEVMHAANVWQC
jgi:hypothetical protein